MRSRQPPTLLRGELLILIVAFVGLTLAFCIARYIDGVERRLCAPDVQHEDP